MPSNLSSQDFLFQLYGCLSAHRRCLLPSDEHLLPLISLLFGKQFGQFGLYCILESNSPVRCLFGGAGARRDLRCLLSLNIEINCYWRKWPSTEIFIIKAQTLLVLTVNWTDFCSLPFTSRTILIKVHEYPLLVSAKAFERVFRSSFSQ